jgi:uncharacterized protein YuzE
MEVHYDEATDTLQIQLSHGISVGSEEIARNFVVDYDEDGNIVSIQIDIASKVVDLRRFASNRPFELSSP